MARLLLATGCAAAWQTFFWIEGVPILTKAGYAGLTVLSAWRPGVGLLVTAALAVLGGPVAGVLGATPSRGSEAVVLAFLTGWIGRAAWTGETVVAHRERLGTFVTLFAAVIACALAVSLFVTHLTPGQQPGYLAMLAIDAIRGYLGPLPGGLHGVQAGALLLEGLLLLSAVTVLSRQAADLPIRLVRMLIVGTIGAALLSVLRLTMGMLRRPDDPVSLLWDTFTELRLAFHAADVNAAASHFAMVILVVAGLVLGHGRRSRWWALAWLPLLAGFWLAGSRAALAVLLVAPFLGLADPRWRRALFVGGPIVVVAVVTVVALLPPADPLLRWSFQQSSVGRLSFLELSWRMWLEAPVWGIGLGEYFGTSARFMPDALKVFFAAENAHNNFAQVGVELGLVGLSLFVGILWISATRIRMGIRAGRRDPLLVWMGIGLLAFLVTALAGHPLLTAPVAYAFWMLLGAAVARGEALTAATKTAPPSEIGRPDPARAGRSGVGSRALALALVLLVACVPLRVMAAVRNLDLSDVRSGFGPGDVDAETGERFTWFGPRATVFVPAGTGAVTMAVSAPPGVSGLVLSFAVDGGPANRVPIEGQSWHDIRLAMPAAGPRGRYWRLDIDVHADVGGDSPGAAQTSGGRVRVRDMVFHSAPG